MIKEDLKNIERELFLSLTRAYLRLARPIGSKILKKEYKFKLSPATIRNYLQRLVNLGYLENVNPSLGRIPTDYGWYYYLEIEKEPKIPWQIFRKLKYFFQKNDDKFFKELSFITKSLIIAQTDYQKDTLSLSSILRNPELKNFELIEELLESITTLHNRFQSVLEKVNQKVTVFVGRDNPLCDSENWSLIVVKEKKYNFGLLTPKRTNYPFHLKLIKQLIYE